MYFILLLFSFLFAVIVVEVLQVLADDEFFEA